MIATMLITETENGLMALQILEKRLPAASPAFIRQLLRKNKILLSGQPVMINTVLSSGDQLILPDSARLRELLQASQQMTVEILRENPLWVVVYKPAGMAVHRGSGHEADNLTDRVQAWLQRQGASFRVSPVHRLDVGTSGPVLFAKGRRTASILGQALMAGQMEKTYLTLAPGCLPETGLLSSPVPAKGKLKEAATRYRVLSRNREWMLLQLDLLSGRTHQIRRQLADAGHPLAGDSRYGGPSLPGLDRPFLHCCRLIWPDAQDAVRQSIICPLPEDLSKVLSVMGINLPAQPIEDN